MEAKVIDGGEIVTWTADADRDAGDVIELPDGRAGVVTVGIEEGEDVGVYVSGLFEVQKTTTMVMLQGTGLQFDYSARKLHLLNGNDRDFYFGTAASTGASAVTTVEAWLNEQPVYTHSLAKGFQHIKVCTAGLMVGMTGAGEYVNPRFDTTAEAQKLDALGIRGIAVGTPCIVDIRGCFNVAPDNAAVDVSLGLASDTHATDADTIAESLFAHMDGNDTKINIESDDGAGGHETAATDSTKTWTAGTPFLVQFDLSDWSDIQAYVNGVNVLPNSTFRLDGATGPMKALVHAEKTADDSPLNFTASIGIRPFTA